MAAAPETIHATAIAVAGRAALIRAPSGGGKSDLALRCLCHATTVLVPHQAQLVSDDRVEIVAKGDVLMARPPPTIAGLFEVRGSGIYSLPYCRQARVCLIADLVDPESIEHLPEKNAVVMLHDIAIPHIRLAAFETSAAAKLLLALSQHERKA